eukprot:GHRQ01003897.1.p1 GENE.GHRQ01003897.1~~GHRQ01003897.1.p1  ORF type:complete len:336 (+),score=101.75 GHRQ01003897.1:288-1295(+)
MAFSQACSPSCLLSRGTDCRQMQQLCTFTRPSSLARHGLKVRCSSVWTHLSSSCRHSTGPCSVDYSCSSRFGRSGPRRQHVQRSATGENGQGNDDLDNYVEVKIESVRVSQGASVVYLRVVGSDGVIPVHIGENESNALLREINKQRQVRPLTHDLMKSMLHEVGYRVTKVRVTDIIANTYYARVHVARAFGEGEVDVDARPSDAINLAVRFGAPVYIAKKIAESAAPPLIEQYPASNETNAEIVRSVRETLANYEDPTIMHQLQKELAVKEERFEDAQQFQESIVHEMTHNRLLRLVVAMESALADGRYEEAAHLRDEYRKAVQQSQTADRKAL